MNRLMLLFLAFLVCGCAHRRTFQVESEPKGAQIEVDGITLCAAAPCKIELKCSEWHQYFVRAAPTRQVMASGATQKLFTQTKIINACSDFGDRPMINFDLELEPIQPTQTIRQ